MEELLAELREKMNQIKNRDGATTHHDYIGPPAGDKSLAQLEGFPEEVVEFYRVANGVHFSYELADGTQGNIDIPSIDSDGGWEFGSRFAIEDPGNFVEDDFYGLMEDPWLIRNINWETDDIPHFLGYKPAEGESLADAKVYYYDHNDCEVYGAGGFSAYIANRISEEFYPIALW